MPWGVDTYALGEGFDLLRIRAVVGAPRNALPRERLLRRAPGGRNDDGRKMVGTATGSYSCLERGVYTATWKQTSAIGLLNEKLQRAAQPYGVAGHVLLASR